MMYSSFILSVFSILSIPFIEMGSPRNAYTNELYSTNQYADSFYTNNLISDFWNTLKNILNSLFDLLYLDFQISQFQLVIAIFALSLIFGFIFKGILNKIDY